MNKSAYRGIVSKDSFLVLTSDNDLMGQFKFSSIAFYLQYLLRQVQSAFISKYESHAIIIRGEENEHGFIRQSF